MNNGDLPANALTGDAYADFANYNEKDKSKSYNPECQGLTKREHFASMALQGLLSRIIPSVGFQDKAEWAVKYADALLYELDKQGI